VRVVVRVRARWRLLSRSYDSWSSYSPIKAGTEKLLRTIEVALLAAYRDTYFRSLREGDAITLTTLDGEFNYLVKFTEIVGPDDIQVLYPTKTETLTLVTCYPFNFIGHAPKRFICPRRARSARSNS
jgi:LPXTG-site transpeptidase (sortase) family protein